MVSSQLVLDSVAHLPRSHLGDVVYEPKLTPARETDPRTGRPPRYGYQSNPTPLPWSRIEGKENCTLTVKIGKEMLAPLAREEITHRRAVWGTDIYTDDSDVVAACIHAGWIRGEWPDDVDVDLLDLHEGIGYEDGPERNRKGVVKREINGTDSQSWMVLTEPPKTGPMAVPENRDLHVTLLILPLLQKYASTTRFGIKSREWGGRVAEGTPTAEMPPHRSVHDGISFMVTGIRWVAQSAQSQDRLRGKARRERIRKALQEVELGPSWGGGARNTPGNTASSEVATTGTSENGGADKKTASWGKQSGKAPSEGDKENLPAPSSEKQSSLVQIPAADRHAVEPMVAAMSSDVPTKAAQQSQEKGSKDGEARLAGKGAGSAAANGDATEDKAAGAGGVSETATGPSTAAAKKDEGA
jgi:hypothetical protein